MGLQTCCCGRLSLRGGSIAVGAVLATLSSLSVAGFLAGLLYLLLEKPVPLPVSVEIIGALLATSALHLVFSIILVHGARHSRRDLLLSWLIFCAIVVILQAMAVVVAVALAGMNSAGAVHSAILASGAVWTGLLGYCFTIVLYHSLELNTLAVKQLGSGAVGGSRARPGRQIQSV